MSNVISNNQGGVFASKNARVVGLDILRIMLALLIYMFHSYVNFGCSYSYLNDFISVGALAMTGFFLLSGYSLRLVYGKRDLMEKQNMCKFYIKRVTGIIPLYYVLSIAFIILCGKESIRDNILLFPIEALGLQSTFTTLLPYTHNGGTWFISCLLIAYAIYPFLQKIVQQISIKSKILFLLILIMIDIWGVVISHKFHTAYLYDNPFFRIFEFTSGVLVADINMENDNLILQILRSRGMLIFVTIVMLIGVLVMQHYFGDKDYMVYNAVVLPCFAMMLFSLGTLKMPILEKSQVIGYLGKIAYCFFMVQFFAWPLGKFIVKYTGYDYNWVRILCTFVYCLIASIIAYELIQKPITKLVKSKVSNEK